MLTAVGADLAPRFAVGVRRRHRASHVPTLRRHGGMGPSRTASATGPPGPDFPPSSGPRSSHSPAWSRSPGACTSPTGRVRIWPGKPSPTELSSRSAPGPSAGSSTGWICNRTAPATGGRPAATPGSRPALRRSSGATGTPSDWPGGATGSSAPMRSPTFRCSNGARSAGPSLARSSSKSLTHLRQLRLGFRRKSFGDGPRIAPGQDSWCHDGFGRPLKSAVVAA